MPKIRRICHSVRRTSQYGEAFKGVCSFCGQEGLTMEDALKPCPDPNGNGGGDDWG